jgi:hypothetical protein
MHESLESQLMRYNDIVEKNSLPKMTASKQRKKVEGGFEGLNKAENGGDALEGRKTEFSRQRQDNKQNMKQQPGRNSF